MRSTVPMTQTVQRNGLSVLQQVLTKWRRELKWSSSKDRQSSGKYWKSLRPCTVMATGSWSTHGGGGRMYCAARLLIGGNYWYARLSVCGKLFNLWPCTLPLDSWSAEITGALDSQSAESCAFYSTALYRAVKTLDLRKLLVRWTLSPRRVRFKGPVGDKNARTVLLRQTLQRKVR